jgi:hypothetical protein
MADVFSNAKRSKVMSRIRSSGNKDRAGLPIDMGGGGHFRARILEENVKDREERAERFQLRGAQSEKRRWEIRLVGLWIGERLSNTLLQTLFAFKRGSGRLLSQNGEQQPFQTWGTAECQYLAAISGVEMLDLRLPVVVKQRHPPVKRFETVDGSLEHGVCVATSRFHRDTGSAVLSEMNFEVLQKNLIRLALDHDQCGVPRSSGLSFIGIRARHESDAQRLGMPP